MIPSWSAFAALYAERELIPFVPPPSAAELPARIPSPFDAEPHPIARRAAELLKRELAPGGEGKMFGVLVVANAAGQVGWLKAFSGHGDVAGFAPVLFAPLGAWWTEGEAALARLEARHVALAARAAELASVRAADEARHVAEREALRVRHRANKAERDAARARGASPEPLEQLSRRDTAEKRHLVQDQAAHWAAFPSVDAELRAVEEERAATSNVLLRQLHDAYEIPLRSMFHPAVPPGGAGDCAAPKLLGQAKREGLRPIAFAEFWWGAERDRRSGAYYPACRGKCGVVLPSMLRGYDVAPAPLFGADAVADPRVVFEDAWLIVVDKPEGLLSVPGRDPRLQDSVSARLGALSVHRLDLDTSGLLLAAKDRATHGALQKQFALREVEKRYVAVLARDVGAEGTIDLALRGDPMDRPRQIVDAVHGKRAITEWTRISPARVAFFPRTGRTHQLRVHAASPLGLGAPIVGDRLYGTGGGRLMLHAEGLAFTHPVTGKRVSLTAPAPF